ncbi:helix-turn-helix transcriptional regulator [Planotetraspora thailandica]|uniref:Helix-turn-helix transcriptional regulator n=1 Tax=Planotetraspora thailandica TaxID=487172 RepID=A0A8J4DFA0_9ACTN|nr:AAA family ATPase [Planotetraspora thailandica]GII59759.1 helix-turn-helix transcriptional regulator [Planotetraspora thailandica]
MTSSPSSAERQSITDEISHNGMAFSAPSENMRDRATEASRALPLRGREAEMLLLRDRLHTLTRGQGGAVLIEGAPGTGKSRLLAEIADLATASGLRVHAGAGVPDGHAVPFAPLLDTLLSGPAPLMARDRLLALSEATDQRFWLLQELQRELEHVASAAPLVIVMDDLQCCDAATQSALRTLPTRLSGRPILWVLATREHRQTASAWPADRIVLRPLSAGAVALLAQDVLQAVAEPALLELARKADGRPLLLVELLNGIREEGAITVKNGMAHLRAAGPIPMRFRSSVRQRLDRLSPPARDSVRFAAMLGRDVDVEVLAELLQCSPVDLMAPLQEALGADLLTDTGGRLAFRHDLTREAVQAGAPAAVKNVIRRQAVDVRLRRGAAVMEVAGDLAKVAQPGDHEAVSLLRRAATDVAPTSPATAVALSSRALELAPADHADRPVLIAETVVLLWLNGHDLEARTMAGNALAGLLKPEAEAQVRLSLARVSSRRSFPEAVRQCRLALALPGLSPATRAQLLTLQARALIMAGDMEETGCVVESALRTAASCGNRAIEATAIAVDATVAFHHMDWRRAVDRQDEAVRLAADAGILRSLWVPEPSWKSFLWSSAGESLRGLEEVDAGLREAQAHGQAAAEEMWSMCRARILLDAGRLADARAEAEAVLAMVEDLGAGNAADVTVLYALGRAALYAGDRQGIARFVADGRRMMHDEARFVARTGAWMLALAADGESDPAHTMTYAAAAVACGPYGEPVTTPLDPADDVVFVRMALRAGDRGAAADMVHLAEDRAERNPDFPFLAAIAAHARGLLDDDTALLVRAAEQFADFSRPIVRASALEDAGRTLAATDQRAAVGHLDTALKLYEQADALRDAARVRRRLRDAGIRRRGRASGYTRGWNGLTASELQVVRLVVQGATNRQVAERLFLSPHTVNTHLRHAYTKLDVNSRVELTRLVVEHDG